MSGTQVFTERPSDFRSSVEVAATYLEVADKLLLLQLARGKGEVGRWGVPAGKLEKGESPKEGAERELFEETGIRVNGSFLGLGCLYIRKPTIDYIYHLFQMNQIGNDRIILSEEHQKYLWASEDDLAMLDLMDGAEGALAFYRKVRR